MPRKPSTEPPAEPATEPTGPETEAPETAAPETSAAPPPPPNAGNRFFSWIRSVDIRREPGWIGGVCAGIAARLGIDPLIVRGIAVVVAVLGGPALLLYAAAWLLLPDSSDRIHLEDVIRGRLEPAIAGIAAFFVLSLLPVTQGFWFAGAGFWGEPNWAPSIGRALWTIALVGLLVWFVVWLARRGNAPAAPRAPRHQPDARAASTAAFVASSTTVMPPADATEPEVAAWREQQAQVRAEQQAFRNQQASDRAAANHAAAEEAARGRAAQRERDRVGYLATRSHPLYSLTVIGLALVAGGVMTVSTPGGVPTQVSVVLGLSTTLAVLAIGMIINGVRGKRAGGASGVAAIVVVPLVLISGFVGNGVGWAPATTLRPTASQDYYYGGGTVDLDLTRVALSESSAGFNGEEVRLFLGAGVATVTVPNNVHVQFTGTVAAGAIDAGTREDSRRIGPVENSSAEFGSDDPDAPQLMVTVQLGAGQIRVVEEGDN